MRRIAAWLLAAAWAAPVLAVVERGAASLSAAEIVDKNIAARGGLAAWQKIRTMVWVGHVQTADGAAGELPFLLEQKRPNMTRFEVKGQGVRSVRGFDGASGWKMRAGRSGEPAIEAYSGEEVKFAREAGGIDGPLIDYQAKGIMVSLDGVDSIDGRKAYRLSLAWPSGTSRHVWIDAESFLDIQSDRQARDNRGRIATVVVRYGDFRTVDGVQIPMRIETSSAMAKSGDKMLIDRVALNPPLEDRQFARPAMPHRRRGVTIDIPAPASGAPSSLPAQHGSAGEAARPGH